VADPVASFHEPVESDLRIVALPRSCCTLLAAGRAPTGRGQFRLRICGDTGRLAVGSQLGEQLARHTRAVRAAQTGVSQATKCAVLDRAITSDRLQRARIDLANAWAHLRFVQERESSNARRLCRTGLHASPTTNGTPGPKRSKDEIKA
jgi:hypothetical protein